MQKTNLFPISRVRTGNILQAVAAPVMPSPVAPVALCEGAPCCLSSAQAGLSRRVIAASASAVPLTWKHLINSFAVGYFSISRAAVSISAVGEGALLPKVRICVKSLRGFGWLSLKPQLLELSLQQNRLDGGEKELLAVEMVDKTPLKT